MLYFWPKKEPVRFQGTGKNGLSGLLTKRKNYLLFELVFCIGKKKNNLLLKIEIKSLSQNIDFFSLSV